MKIIAACGNDCASCPRYNVAPYEKTPDELHQTAVLWQKIGYKDHVATDEEISCSGCKPENWCRYRIASCVSSRGIRNCGECDIYPCDNFRNCLEVTSSFEPACRKACTKEQYDVLCRAFFRKEENLSEADLSEADPEVQQTLRL